MRYPLPFQRAFCVLMLSATIASAQKATQTESTWISKAEAYLKQERIDTKSDRFSRSDSDSKSKKSEILLQDLLDALPEPEKWGTLDQQLIGLKSKLATSGQKAACDVLRLTLAYLCKDAKALDALSKPFLIEKQQPENLEKTKMEAWSNLVWAVSELKEQLITDPSIKPEDKVKTFEDKLAELVPMTEEEAMQIAGGKENLQKLRDYFNEYQIIHNKFLALYQLGSRVDDKAQQKIEKEMVTLHEKHSAAQEIHGKLASSNQQKYMKLRTYLQGATGNSHESLQVPDLVTLAGETKARELLTKALSSSAQLSFRSGKKTERLAREVAIEKVDLIIVPPWELAQSMDAKVLFEVLQKKFPASAQAGGNHLPNSERDEAEFYYGWRLVIDGEPDRALAIFKKLSSNTRLSLDQPITALREAGHTEKLWAFLDRLLKEQYVKSLWDDYVELSAETSHLDEMLALAKAVSAREGIGSEGGISANDLMAKAFFAADKKEEGLRAMRLVLGASTSVQEAVEKQFSSAQKLAQIGNLLGDTAIQEEGLERAAVFWKKLVAIPNQSHSLVWKYHEYSQLLIKCGKLAQAREGILEVQQVVNQPMKKDQDSYSINNRAENRLSMMTALVSLEWEAGRSEEVIRLLEQSPYWCVDDLAEAIEHAPSSEQKHSLGVASAAALIKANRTNQARAALEVQIAERPGHDPAYALYCKLLGAEALPYLDALQKVDQFEERPLIWKARLALDAGKLDEAEKLAKQAVAIDPSDGEQGKEDRMRAYDIQGEIATKRGDTKQAAFFAEVMTAIRMGEDADDYYSAGLLSEAIRRYEKAITHFSDAYCVQSRLAIQLSKAGRHEEAEAHYRKAYELMPDSFGRVESHCFGCERAFDGERAQGIAERVFSDILAKRPNLPQAHYLMGYLQEHREQHTEALASYKKAVELDPEYLNAWKKISGLKDEMQLDAATMDQVALKLLFLDPASKHGSPDYDEVTDFAGLWKAMKQAEMTLAVLKTPVHVMPLTSSAAAIKGGGPKVEKNEYRSGHKTFGEAMLTRKIMQAFENMISASHVLGGTVTATPK